MSHRRVRAPTLAAACALGGCGASSSSSASRAASPASTTTTAFLYGKPWTKDPRAIPLVPLAAIQLDVGSPPVKPQPVSWAGANL